MNLVSKLIATLTLALCLVTTGCDGGTRVSGRILGTDGRPMAGVEVRFTHRDRSYAGTTSEDGRYDIGMTHAPFRDVRSTITASKPGYKTFNKELSSSDSPIHLDIVMVPQSSK